MNRSSERDRGAIVVWFAVFIVVLLGSGALIVDMGALYDERRQLQNGSDAGALAVAVGCTQDGTCTAASANANTYADVNAADGASAVDLVCGRGPALTACSPAPAGTSTVPYYVQVATSTDNPGNQRRAANEVEFRFAPFLPDALLGSTVHADTVVAWGPLGSAADVLPIALSRCSFTAAGGSVGADGSLTFVGGIVQFVFSDVLTDGTSCLQSSGSFGWIDQSDGTRCVAAVDITGTNVLSGADPGQGREQLCETTFDTYARAGDTRAVALPLFNTMTGGGNNGTYEIAGLAGFDLCAFRFTSMNPAQFRAQECGGTTACPVPTGANADRLVVCGTFRPLTIGSGEFGGTDFGARLVKVIG